MSTQATSVVPEASVPPAKVTDAGATTLAEAETTHSDISSPGITKSSDKSLVLVTGGSGFIGLHCIVKLLQAGYAVRTTVRSLSREAQVRDALRSGGEEAADRLTFAAADLTNDAGWKEAVVGCEFVLHVASPFPLDPPKHENDLIIPAREGVLRVLRAARDGGVKRVVMTSSFVAVGYGHGKSDKIFTEADWTNLEDKSVAAYPKSKVIAERAAWDFMAKEGADLELSVINPVAVFGPILGSNVSGSTELVKRLMDGSFPRVPNIHFGIVDVRDVAELHIRAMTSPAAKGERFIAVAGENMSLQEVALFIRESFPKHASKVPTKTVPDCLMKIGAWFSATAKMIVGDVGVDRKVTNEKARTVLGWKPMTNEEAVKATVNSLIDMKLVK